MWKVKNQGKRAACFSPGDREAEMNKFLKWQNQDSPNKNRILALLAGALIFPALIPAFLVLVCPNIDRSLGFASFYHGPANILAGVLAILAGGILAVWTIVVQIMLASGTPFPMLPTQKLLIVGPFQYCRNPMTLGTVVAYAGVAVLVGSYTALAVVGIFAALLICYLKFIEEKELQLRFGDEYIAYKERTPFIIPIRYKR
jgi:protein-S-isoprenylcysteine O-methyltransferase Ste14